MKFNLGVTAILAISSVVTIAPLVAEADGQMARALLVACIAAAAAVVVWRVLQRGQEPAIFAAATYLALGGVVAITQALAGDYIRAVIIAITLPILPGLAVGDRRTRQWINRVAGLKDNR
ncbi:hypothetical protein [Rhodococcus tukisamuensis]|uniref:Uncharacterized protein n=1 Tax=Rhodococcus tukisamuensis TaxID=168276 RepID=A0A1G6MKE0_9NOCA|nr:hypothetical protein [Rhodococcus tukisamuensis]SDC56078.1 hypothetical protein SAMN05444580_101217 [Rhodococcus tukisamuensis]